jgi:hypothetical protein
MFLVFNIGNKIGLHEFGNWKVDVHQGHALHVRSTLLVFILRKLFFIVGYPISMHVGNVNQLFPNLA